MAQQLEVETEDIQPATLSSDNLLLSPGGRKVELEPLAKNNEEMFPTIEFENEVNYSEDDDSLCGPDPTISNVAKFLSSCDFSTEEKQEFFFLLSQGLNIDEASDRIYQKRLEQFISSASSNGKKFKYTKEWLQRTVHDTEKSVRPRYPLRLHGFLGNREDDVQMLVKRGYRKEVAVFLVDFMYEMGGDYIAKLRNHNGQLVPEEREDEEEELRKLLQAQQEEEKRNLQQKQRQEEEEEEQRMLLLKQHQEAEERKVLLRQQQQQEEERQRQQQIVQEEERRKLQLKQQQEEEELRRLQLKQQQEEEELRRLQLLRAEEEEQQQQLLRKQQEKLQVPDDESEGEYDEINIHSEDGQPIAADTIVQLKRLRNFARGGFKSNFSIENNCAVSEHEALKLGLIVSQQEADYGINMYDALMPSDEQQIEQLIRTRITLDEAILKVFESRFGKTKLDSSALGAVDEIAHRGGGNLSVLRNNNVHSISGDMDYEAADKLESEISLLVLSGYSREKAVKILLQRKKKKVRSFFLKF
jgi:hypothetical protein